ncbi:hypothetical protein BAE44_0006426 [Dichanthelium oligosanthes]|uniref:Uncharacterized protein n=1 Tax=Dichanthelium oligosanthes TaxID=888268 RepID=A0A1E5W5D3_9POAL|nr:hypothetical protein BAE44_0006426 [Dichanthelium oligosanthes]
MTTKEGLRLHHEVVPGLGQVPSAGEIFNIYAKSYVPPNAALVSSSCCGVNKPRWRILNAIDWSQLIESKVQSRTQDGADGEACESLRHGADEDSHAQARGDLQAAGTVHELHRLYRVQEQLMSSGLSRPPSELISCRRQTRRVRQPRRALNLGLHLPAAADDYILVGGAGNATPPPRQDDGLELTLAVGSGGASRRKRRVDGTGTPLGSDCSGGSLTSLSSTDTASGLSPCRRTMPAFLRLQEGTAVLKQPQQSPWLVQCLSLKMA